MSARMICTRCFIAILFAGIVPVLSSCNSYNLVSITINPSTTTITLPEYGYQYGWKYQAIGYYGPAGHQTSQDITDQVTWTSYASQMITVSNGSGTNGSATTTGFVSGDSYIAASMQGGFGGDIVSNLASVTVAFSTTASGVISSSGTVISIILTDASNTMTIGAVGGTLALEAMATTADGTSSNIAPSCTWSTSNSAVATVSSTGVVTAVGAGNSVISAMYTNSDGTKVNAAVIITVS